MDAHIVFLLALPYTPPTAATRAAPALSGAELRPPVKSAPHFYEIDVALTELGRTAVTVEGQPVSVRRQLIDDQVLSIECAYTLPDALSAEGLALKKRLNAALRELLLREADYHKAFTEEYTAICFTGIAPTPDEFVSRSAAELAALLRSERPSRAEAEQTLISRVRYTDDDLTIVDWEGALIIDAHGDFQSDIELLKIGNYQLLRYRLLDRAIERNLERVSRELKSRRLQRFSSAVLREALQQRLELLLNFEKIEQALLLIGDWYTAQLYRLIVDEFYIDEWKAAVRQKLEQLDSITDTVRENFTFNWRRFLDFVELGGWLLLLAGYFILFFLEASRAR